MSQQIAHFEVYMNFDEEIKIEARRFLTRRWFFKECGIGLGSLALASLLNDKSSAQSAITNPLAKNIHAVADNVQNLIEQLHPQVIVTWGRTEVTVTPIIGWYPTRSRKWCNPTVPASNSTIRDLRPRKPSHSTPSGPRPCHSTPSILPI